MLRSDYKYSREPSIDSTTGDKSGEVLASVGGGIGTGKDLTAGVSGSGSSSGNSSRRSGSMKNWSPLAALGKKARDSLRRCNTVRAGLGGSTTPRNDEECVAGASAAASGGFLADRGGRRNAMSNIFLGQPSSGVRRLFAVYGIDDARGGTSKSPTSPTSANREESLFARHTRTSSVRSRPPSYSPATAGGGMQYQQMLMQKQQQQFLLQPQYQYYQTGQQQSLDRRRSSSMRDHSGRQMRHAVSPGTSYGNR